MRQHQPTGDEIYLALQRALPGWATRTLRRYPQIEASPLMGEGLGVLAGEFIAGEATLGETSIDKDPIYGALADFMGDFYAWFSEQTQGLDLDTAMGEWLDLHAAGRGYTRIVGEDDSELRPRIRDYPEAATHRAIRRAINGIVRGGSTIVAIDYDARTLDIGAGDVAIESGAVIAEGDGTLIAFEDLEVGDHVEIDSQLPDATPTTWIRRVAYVFTFRDRSVAWGQGYFGQGFWGWPVSPATMVGLTWPSPLRVFVVAIPPQVVGTESYWGQDFWGQFFWSGESEDTARIESIRAAAERTKAAGTICWIWIQEA